MTTQAAERPTVTRWGTGWDIPVNITEQQSQEALEAELEEAEAEAGIERDESDADVDEVGAETDEAATEE